MGTGNSNELTAVRWGEVIVMSSLQSDGRGNSNELTAVRWGEVIVMSSLQSDGER